MSKTIVIPDDGIDGDEGMGREMTTVTTVTAVMAKITVITEGGVEKKMTMMISDSKETEITDKAIDTEIDREMSTVMAESVMTDEVSAMMEVTR